MASSRLILPSALVSALSKLSTRPESSVERLACLEPGESSWLWS
jgi:hypothetical protein